MKKQWPLKRLISSSLLTLLSLFGFLSVAVQPAWAQSCSFTVSGAQDGAVQLTHTNQSVYITIQNAEINGELINAPDDAAFYINVPEAGRVGRRYYIPSSLVNNGVITTSLQNDSAGTYLFDPNQSHTLQLVRDWGPATNHTVVCEANAIVVRGNSDQCTITHQVTKNPDGNFNLGITVNTTQLDRNSGYYLTLDTGLLNAVNQYFEPESNGFSFVQPLDASYANRTFQLYVRPSSCLEFSGGACAVTGCSAMVTFPESAPVVPINYETADGIEDVNPDAVPVMGGRIATQGFEYCLQVPDGRQREACNRCYSEADAEGDRVYTALGCVRTNGAGLTRDVVRVFMGVAGGVAFFSILSAAFMFSLSQGDTNKVKQARELLTAAVSGLFFIILSIFILQFIGVNILGIPGLSS